VHKKLSGNTAHKLTSNGERDIPYHMTSCSAYKAGGRRRKGGTFRMLAFVFSSNCYMCRSLALLEMTEPVDGE